jgi:phosphopantetheinyl transferase
LQHLAGRFLLQFLFPDFPYELIKIADTRKPFLPDEQYHFSISHCGDYAAAIVSKDKRVGIDIELNTEKIEKLKHKFLSEKEQTLIAGSSLAIHDLPAGRQGSRLPTLFWSAKEAVFKWYGDGGVDFRKDIRLLAFDENKKTIAVIFAKTNQQFMIHYSQFGQLSLAWIVN